MPEMHTGPVLNWASMVEDATIRQAAKTARMPFVQGHVALMPDAHVGLGSTVGSVFGTQGAIIPAAIGVDIGCGMVANHTDLTLSDLPDSLASLMPLVEQRIPAGVGKGHESTEHREWIDDIGFPHTELNNKQAMTCHKQFGTLGSGNHFVEVCSDERGQVWTVLHSGSRGIGNQLARVHIDGAKKLMRQYFINLEDPDLAYFTQGTPEFTAYINDMLWAQKYAFASRSKMARELTRSLFEVVGHGRVLEEINCHHNFTQMEHHHGKDLWITRKGAIKAAVGSRGVIPGSMGTETYVISGLGNPASFNSCSHGAGRKMSRRAAKENLTTETLAEKMSGKVWNNDRAKSLVDEHPDAYKDIHQVMEDQKDLCTIDHTLTQLFNYKG
jgi:tRNA-splicing ligase RtcB (3'-phosphate/5'-hydroxy nucleic acid ligase)